MIPKTKINNEITRTYTYLDRFEKTIRGVVEFSMDEDGNHTLQTSEGSSHYIVPGWRTLDISRDILAPSIEKQNDDQ